MEKALENTIIAKTYRLTLKSFFKDQFRYGNDCYKPKGKFLVIFELVAVIFAKNNKNATVISFSILSN